MSIGVVYLDRSLAIGDKFELEAEELYAMKARGGREDSVEILPRQVLWELSRILGWTSQD
jgi:hypothetical protein